MTITNSSIASVQNIVIRGAGKTADPSKFNAENTIIAANSGLTFENMNDNNLSRYEKILAFYSSVPIAIINSNFELLQGAFITRDRNIVIAGTTVNTFRGFLFSPQGIDDVITSSYNNLSIDTYNYNLATGITNSVSDPSVISIGKINAVEYASFPEELLGNVGSSNTFWNAVTSVKDDSSVYVPKYNLSETTVNPGKFLINSYLLSEYDIIINVDYLQSGTENYAVIGSENGDIIINAAKGMDFYGIIYAPNGKVVLTATGAMNGRIFAKEIEVNGTNLTITSGNDDISDLGFVTILPPIVETLPDVVTSTPTSEPSEITTSVPSTPETTDATPSVTTPINPEDIVTTTTSVVVTSPPPITTDPSIDYLNVQYDYDKLGRLIKVFYDENNYIEYQYDSNGNITKITTIKDGEIQ